jgi:phosphate transport system permease protein
MRRAEQRSLGAWVRSGAPWVWLTAGAVALSVMMVAGLVALIAWRGLGHFWPSDIVELKYLDDEAQQVTLIGRVTGGSDMPLAQYVELTGLADTREPRVERTQLKTGNRDHQSPDFRWLFTHRISETRAPEDLVEVERLEWGSLFGRLREVVEAGRVVARGEDAWAALQARVLRVEALRADASTIENDEIGKINAGIEALRLAARADSLDTAMPPQARNERAAARAAEELALQASYAEAEARLMKIREAMGRDHAVFELSGGMRVDVQLEQVVHAWQPNRMSALDKLGHYAGALGGFLADGPREANTEGGIFPAIFGTVVMVLLMSVVVAPFGVIAAVYLREYAKPGPFVRLIRIAVNNLAGVPSIVYGVFGLGFFVYFLGGNIDRLLYPEALPAPTFGTPGLMWASLTLALLTVPVVIVSTEEGLSRIPRALREGSLALGATKAETLLRVVLPMASPSILTGVILAIARAAGEVAPLMLVGVVKLAPALPIDDTAPFVHLERKFMHLGFHIYDVGFQSPNVDAARPIVYATAFLLVLIILSLNLSAILLRSRLERRYRTAE